MAKFQHREARLDGIRLHWVEAGRGPLVVLLHGFPEFWYSWRVQISALADAGFRVVAPDQRGYNRSEKPRELRAYRMDALAGDVVALIRHLGEERAVVAGHDWGGAVAWHLARRRPEVLDRLVILNAPHPAAYRRALRTSDQLLRSWYIFFFQLPWLPELAIRAFDYRVLERVLRRDPVRPDAFTDADVARYKEALSRPGALRGALSWYRANFRALASDFRALAARGRAGGVDPADREPDAVDASDSGAPEGSFPGATARPLTEAPARDRSGRDGRIRVPTLVIWGVRDRYLSPRLVENLDVWVRDLRVERLPEASHWVMADAPERVSRLMTEFVAGERR